MASHESYEQERIFAWARHQVSKYPQLKLLHHITNEGKRSVVAGASLKKQGLLSGVSDICLPVANDKYNVLYIELKVGSNKATKAQLEFISLVNEFGGKALVVYGADAAKEVIKNYISNTIDDMNIVDDIYPPRKSKKKRGVKDKIIGSCGKNCLTCTNMCIEKELIK